MKRSAQLRLSQTEVVDVFTLEQGNIVRPDRASRLVKRGIAAWHSGRLVVTAEGREAFRRWSGT